MSTFWEKAAHSINRILSLYYYVVVILFIFSFWFSINTPISKRLSALKTRQKCYIKLHVTLNKTGRFIAHTTH